MNILITGAEGFMGRNLREALYQRPGAQHDTFALIDVRSPEAELRARRARGGFCFSPGGR